ncbi:MAG: FkbM family methyltransferase [Cyanobacteria bacterium]|nr:FkbM family methyltransferase [Cyanobacteriota bacterium]
MRVDESLRRYQLDNEADVYDEIIARLPGGGLFVDVGANVGLHTILAAFHMGQRGRVLAVEPVPANLELLRKNLQLNGLLDRCQIFPFALTETGDLSIRMSVEPGLSPAASISQTSRNTENSISVATKTLDDICEAAEKIPDLIKIDVEGAEHEVLKGARRTLTEGPDLLIEVHRYALPDIGSSEEALTEYLLTFGYRQIRLPQDKSSKLGGYHHSIFTKH